jgi:chemotaxis protein CheD
MRNALATRFAEETQSARRFLNSGDGCWHVQITQGETYVTGNDKEVLTTILGSCIAACIRDESARVGGINHFLLPGGKGADRSALRYGVNAMEILINGLLKRGATRGGLEAKLFGGANVIAGLSNIGAGNADFARQYLADEGIRLVGGDVGGNHPRRIQYWPLTGRARQLSIPTAESRALAARERETIAMAQAQTYQDQNDVELF